MPLPDSSTDVAIVGAGPYGLSLASHLTHRSVEHRVFGRPMDTWLHMFPTMGLKSPDFGTNIYTPRSGYSFIEYCVARGIDYSEPIAIALFARYGLWAQEQLVPEVETCLVSRVAAGDGGFAVRLDTGESVRARRVVMATGLRYWPRVPAVLAGLPGDLVTHTSRQIDFEALAGRDVTVLGAGQSALEAATLAHEHGANVRLLVRGAGAWFADPPTGPRPLKMRLLYPKSVLGPGRLNLFLEKVPTAVHHLMSEKRRVRLTRTHLGPWGAWWLRERFEGKVPVHPHCEVVAATGSGSGLRLRVRRAGQPEWALETDHVICGTGYEVDLDRLPILERELAARIRRVERAPRLDRHFESSVAGLYFLGAAAAFSFGPLLRFVAGGAYAAPALARRLATSGRVPAVHRRPAGQVPMTAD